jgi:hypothetical protein
MSPGRALFTFQVFFLGLGSISTTVLLGFLLASATFMSRPVTALRPIFVPFAIVTSSVDHRQSVTTKGRVEHRGMATLDLAYVDRQRA